MNQNEIITHYIQVLPDFALIKPILFPHIADDQFEKLVANYVAEGSKLSLEHMTEIQAKRFERDISTILSKESLENHKSNLTYIVIYLYNHLYHLHTHVNLPNYESTKRVYEFLNNFKTLLKYSSKNFKIVIEEQLDKQQERKLSKDLKLKKTYKKTNVTFKDALTNRWIIETLIKAIKSKDYPLSLGNQLGTTDIVFNESKNQYQLQNDAPNGAFHYVSAKELLTEPIVLMSIPIINYLELHTTIRKDDAKHWSSAQLSVVLEILILTGMYSSKQLGHFIFGESEPTIGDKKSLDSLLKNQIKRGKLLV